MSRHTPKPDPHDDPTGIVPPPPRDPVRPARTDKNTSDDEHIGATEDQVGQTPAPRGDTFFKDEPKQG